MRIRAARSSPCRRSLCNAPTRAELRSPSGGVAGGACDLVEHRVRRRALRRARGVPSIWRVAAPLRSTASMPSAAPVPSAAPSASRRCAASRLRGCAPPSRGLRSVRYAAHGLPAPGCLLPPARQAASVARRTAARRPIRATFWFGSRTISPTWRVALARPLPHFRPAIVRPPWGWQPLTRGAQRQTAAFARPWRSSMPPKPCRRGVVLRHEVAALSLVARYPRAPHCPISWHGAGPPLVSVAAAAAWGVSELLACRLPRAGHGRNRALLAGHLERVPAQPGRQRRLWRIRHRLRRVRRRLLVGGRPPAADAAGRPHRAAAPPARHLVRAPARRPLRPSLGPGGAPPAGGGGRPSACHAGHAALLVALPGARVRGLRRSCSTGSFLPAVFYRPCGKSSPLLFDRPLSAAAPSQLLPRRSRLRSCFAAPFLAAPTFPFVLAPPAPAGACRNPQAAEILKL